MRSVFRLEPPRVSENDVEAGCRTLLELRSYWYVKLHAGVFQSLDGRRKIRGVKKGTPDYAVMHARYRSFLLEVKRPGGELSDDQVVEIAEIRRRYRLPIAVVESAEQLSEWLAQHERAP